MVKTVFRKLIIASILLLGFVKMEAQVTVNEQEEQNVITQKKDSVGVQRNPFNPLMGVMPLKNYSENLTVSRSLIEDRTSPFARPEVFVERVNPKFREVKVNYDPSRRLDVLPINDEILGYWEKENKLGLDLNQISFVNWSSGGDNSISGLLKANIGRKYIKNRLVWENFLNVRYGVNQQSGRELRKTDDVLEVISNIGYRSSAISDWYYVSKFNFRTQFTNGYSYPNTDNPVSRFMAPAYLFLGIGGEYVAPKSKMKFYISPLTYKATFVTDQILADQGAFGVKKAVVDDDGNIIEHGKKYKAEIGFLVSSEWKKEIVKNIFLDNRISLYSDYADHFGNIDVMWELKFDLKVNQYVNANIGMHLIYDDNVKTKVERDGEQVMEGPRVQFKQLLGVGFVYSF